MCVLNKANIRCFLQKKRKKKKETNKQSLSGYIRIVSEYLWYIDCEVGHKTYNPKFKP